MDDEQLEDLIKSYFILGLNHNEIMLSLSSIHGVVLSIRTLRRILSRLRLFRRKHQSDILDVALFLMNQLETRKIAGLQTASPLVYTARIYS